MTEATCNSCARVAMEHATIFWVQKFGQFEGLVFFDDPGKSICRVERPVSATRSIWHRSAPTRSDVLVKPVEISSKPSESLCEPLALLSSLGGVVHSMKGTAQSLCAAFLGNRLSSAGLIKNFLNRQILNIYFLQSWAVTTSKSSTCSRFQTHAWHACCVSGGTTM